MPSLHGIGGNKFCRVMDATLISNTCTMHHIVVLEMIVMLPLVVVRVVFGVGAPLKQVIIAR